MAHEFGRTVSYSFNAYGRGQYADRVYFLKDVATVPWSWFTEYVKTDATPPIPAVGGTITGTGTSVYDLDMDELAEHVGLISTPFRCVVGAVSWSANWRPNYGPPTGFEKMEVGLMECVFSDWDDEDDNATIKTMAKFTIPEEGSHFDGSNADALFLKGKKIFTMDEMSVPLDPGHLIGICHNAPDDNSNLMNFIITLVLHEVSGSSGAR